MGREPVHEGERKYSRGLLETLYEDGTFRESWLEYGAKEDAPARTEGILAAYRNLIKDYPAARLEQAGHIPEDLWSGLKRLGIFGLNVPEEYGGTGLGLRGYLTVIENMARTDMALAIIPTAHLSIGIKGIILFGTEEQKRRYLPRAASGEMIFAYALTEPNVGSDAQHIETSALLEEGGGHYVLNGTKTYITNGGYAGGLTVFAQMDPARPGFMGAFIVETAWGGVKVGQPMPKMGLTISSTTTISFTNVRVPKDNLIGQPGDGFRIAMTILNYGRLGLGAASAGAMRQSLEDMLKRALSRRQFGEPIGNFELVQEKIVRAEINSTVAAAMTNFTARLLERDPTATVAIESSHTKLFGTTRAWETLYDALQVAGGAGYLSTQPYEKRMRDFRVTTVFEGTTEIHSIYPPLYLLRNVGKRIVSLQGHPLKKFGILYRLLGGNTRIPHMSGDQLIHDAMNLLRTNARRVRRLVARALIRHGTRVASEQFLLRRITHLSMYAFGILSLVVFIRAKERDGTKATRDRNVLALFLEEARQVSRSENRLGRDRAEALHRITYKTLTAEKTLVDTMEAGNFPASDPGPGSPAAPEGEGRNTMPSETHQNESDHSRTGHRP